jgi:hypothetical protein
VHAQYPNELWHPRVLKVGEEKRLKEEQERRDEDEDKMRREEKRS